MRANVSPHNTRDDAASADEIPEDHERASYQQLTRYGTGLYADVIQACEVVGTAARFVHTSGTVPSVQVDLADHCSADIQAPGDLGLPWIRDDLRGWSIAIRRTDITDPLAGQGMDVRYEIITDSRVELVPQAIRTAQAIAEIVDDRDCLAGDRPCMLSTGKSPIPVTPSTRTWSRRSRRRSTDEGAVTAGPPSALGIWCHTGQSKEQWNPYWGG